LHLGDSLYAQAHPQDQPQGWRTVPPLATAGICIAAHAPQSWSGWAGTIHPGPAEPGQASSALVADRAPSLTFNRRAPSLRRGRSASPSPPRSRGSFPRTCWDFSPSGVDLTTPRVGYVYHLSREIVNPNDRNAVPVASGTGFRISVRSASPPPRKIGMRPTDGGEPHPFKEWVRQHPKVLPPDFDPSKPGTTTHQMRDALKRVGWTVEETDTEVHLIPPDGGGARCGSATYSRGLQRRTDGRATVRAFGGAAGVRRTR
jgi:hypothetical protein